MNENVTNMTPKRRRWIARLLVSALCILLASSLLFVGVVADNIELVAQFSSNYGLAATPAFVYPFSNYIAYSNGYFVYLNSGSTVNSAFDVRGCSSYNTNYIAKPMSFFWDGTVLYSIGISSRKENNSTYYYTLALYSFSLVSGEIVSGDVQYFPISSSYTTDCFNRDGSFSVIDGDVFGCFSYNTSSTTTNRRTVPFKIVDSVISVSSYNTSFVKGDGKLFSFVSGSFMVVSCANNVSNLVLLYSIFDLSPPTRLSFYGSSFSYENDFYLVNSEALLLWDESTNTFLSVGNGIPGLTFYAENGVLYSYNVPSSLSVPYTVYSGLPTTEPPPESSDETTTEPPPESSEESSKPSSALTNVWKVDRGFKEALAGSIDLSGATRIRAFLGVFTSSGSSFASDRAVPLTIEVYRNGLDSPDIYTFDFFAYGWGATSNGFPNSYDSYTFPDVVGLYYDIPIPADGEGLLFPTFAPYGSIYVNFSDSVFPDDIQRVTFNLHNSQGYLDVNFISSSSTSFTIYNDDLTKGKTYIFDSGTFNYKCFFDLDGEYSETEWFSPQFGSSIKYSAEDVLESGLYAIYSFNDDSIEYPWGNGEWSEAISNANSRLDQVSLDYEILESKANEAYGQFSFNSMTGQDFIGAVSNFESIKDSSGGSYILDYFFGMWNVHPFASSMIAIVGTLAIVGFIIRKL